MPLPRGLGGSPGWWLARRGPRAGSPGLPGSGGRLLTAALLLRHALVLDLSVHQVGSWLLRFSHVLGPPVLLVVVLALGVGEVVAVLALPAQVRVVFPKHVSVPAVPLTTGEDLPAGGADDARLFLDLVVTHGVQSCRKLESQLKTKVMFCLSDKN